MLAVFSAAILLSAALLFTLQPMVAKLLLPLLGGSPSVWNTCMLFFQAGLLAGYGYAHLLATKLPPRVQLAVHAGVLLLSGLALPIAVRGGEPSGEGSPAAWLLGALALSAGLPFFAVSTTGPLLQRWFSRTDHPEAHDPYFLYAASNIGSLGGLLAYPFVIEPWLPLRTGWMAQTSLWSAGYVAFGALVIGAGWLAQRHPSSARAEHGRSASHQSVASVRSVDPGWRRRLFWLVLAFVPSSLLLGTTQYLTTDIAAIPFLWVVPLVLYLATFVVAFARRRPSWLVAVSGIVLAVSAAATALTRFPSVPSPVALRLLLPLLTLTAAGLVAHSRLSDSRPAADRLTEFYFFVALGGVLGGAFNALVAPVLFPDVWEYPIALALACALRAPWRGDSTEPRPVRGIAIDVGFALAIAAVAFAAAARHASLEAMGPLFSVWIRAGLPTLLVLATLGWRRRFALCFAALLCAAWVETARTANIIHQERTFFGVHRILKWESPPFKEDAENAPVRHVAFHVLVHGGTRHGTQAQDPEWKHVPTTYYHPTGPAGEIFEALGAARPSLRIALVGLGAGTLAAYGRAGDSFTVYDIDPVVVRIASDPQYFSYTRDSPAHFDWIIGDGRMSIKRAHDGAYDLIVLDAFSSDAIPVHLLTREAIRTYLTKLAPGGLLAVHLSNQYIDLPPVVAAVAAAEGASALVRWDRVDALEQALQGKDDSVWAVVASPSSLQRFAGDPKWIEVAPGRVPPWTDDFSNVLRALKLVARFGR